MITPSYHLLFYTTSCFSTSAQCVRGCNHSKSTKTVAEIDFISHLAQTNSLLPGGSSLQFQHSPGTLSQSNLDFILGRGGAGAGAGECVVGAEVGAGGIEEECLSDAGVRAGGGAVIEAGAVDSKSRSQSRSRKSKSRLRNRSRSRNRTRSRIHQD